jgi:hypothetical protein
MGSLGYDLRLCDHRLARMGYLTILTRTSLNYEGQAHGNVQSVRERFSITVRPLAIVTANSAWNKS